MVRVGKSTPSRRSAVGGSLSWRSMAPTYPALRNTVDGNLDGVSAPTCPVLRGTGSGGRYGIGISAQDGLPGQGHFGRF